MRLRVLTYNIHHGVGMDGRLGLGRIGRVIADSGADIAGLQEVDRTFGERSGFADQAHWLAEQLSMHVVYGTSIDLDPHHPDRPRRRYGNALLSRFPLRDERVTLLPRAGRSPEAEDRCLLSARIDVAGESLTTYTTHLHPGTRRGRLVQAERVSELVTASPTGPVVLLGDFNARPGTAEIRTLGRGLLDAWRVAGNGRGYTFNARHPRIRIDYVLVSADLEVLSAQVLNTRASDHRPMLVEVRSG